MNAVQPAFVLSSAVAVSGTMTGAAFAMTEVARFEASSSTSTDIFRSFGNQTLLEGQTVTYTFKGAEGARIQFFVGSALLIDIVLPASGMATGSFILTQDYSGETSVGILDNTDMVTTMASIVVTEGDDTGGGDTGGGDDDGGDDGGDTGGDDDNAGDENDDTGGEDEEDEDDAGDDDTGEEEDEEDDEEEDEDEEDEDDAPELPEITANGQAASDQIRAIIETIVPGLSGDLGDAFFIPDPNGGQSGLPNAFGQNPNPPIVPAAPPQVPVAPRPERNNDGATQRTAEAETTGQCNEDELAALRAQLAREKERLERLSEQARTLDVTSTSFGSFEILLTRAQDFLRAAQEGPVLLNNLDQLAIQAAVNQLQSVDPSVVEALDKTGSDLQIARNAEIDARSKLNSAESSFGDNEVRIKKMREALEAIQRGESGVVFGDTLGPTTTDPDEIRRRIESLEATNSIEGSELPALREEAERTENEAAAAQQAHDAVRAQVEGLDNIEDTLAAALKNAAERIFEPVVSSGQKVEELEAKIQQLEDDCDEDDQNAYFSPSSNQPSPVQFAVRSLGSEDRLSFSISTRNMDTTLDPSVTVFFGADVTFHNDGRTGVGQDGETFAMAGGVSWQVGLDTTVGLAARYARTDVSGLSGSTEADTSSVAAFVQGRVTDRVFYEVVGAYTISDLDAVFIQPGITTTGRPDVDSFALQGSLSGQVQRGDVTIRPSVGLRYVHVDQDAFLLSDGTLAPDQTTDRVSLNAGAQFSKQIRNEALGRSTTPYAGLTAIAHLSDTKSFLLPNGTFSEAGVFGASANFGFSVSTDRGISYSLGGSVSAFEQGQTSYGLNVNLTIPFN